MHININETTVNFKKADFIESEGGFRFTFLPSGQVSVKYILKHEMAIITVTIIIT